MKVVAKPIEVIPYTDAKGDIRPLRMKFEVEGNPAIVVKIDRIIEKHIEKLAGNYMWLFRCQSTINNTQRIFELKYELETCKWIIFKI